MKIPLPIRTSIWKISGSVIIFLLLNLSLCAQTDLCTNPTVVTSSFASCSSVTGTVVGATLTTGAGYPAVCTGTVKYDVWYQFTAISTSPTFTFAASTGTNSANFTSPGIQLLSGTCGSFTQVACSNGFSTMSTSGLTIGTTYYIRIYSTSATAAPTTKGSFTLCIQDPPSNDNCMGAVPITSGLTCSNTTGTLQYATSSGVAGNCGGATASTTYDVWYQFTANSTSHTITPSSLSGLTTTTTYMELLNGNCTSGFTSLFCQNAASAMVATGLTVGKTYYLRVYVTSNPTAASSFSLCITNTITNDNCTGATALTEVYGTTPTTAGTFVGATTSGTATTCGLSSYPDVWYSFVATSQFPVITVSSLGTSLTTAKTYIQLFSGSCGGLTSLQCASGALTLTPSTALTVGNTYFIRVYENMTAVTTGTTYNFQIVVSNLNANVDYGKSYVRIKGGIQPGTIIPGDTLQIRATFVVKNNTAYKCTFTDNIPAGTTYVPNSLKILTNEGNTFLSFPDATTTDAGIATGYPGTVTAVTINMGTGATSATGGSVVNTASPSFYGGACIMVLSYEVAVPLATTYGTKIAVGKGALSYQLTSGAAATNVTFPTDTLVVYNNYGICSNTVGTNAITSEAGGTFDTGIPKNRYASSKVPSNYIDTIFTNNSPQDYYYGISNNTSAAGVGYSTVNTWAYPDNSLSGSVPSNSHRLFSLEDIIGDHTNATNPLLGNPPADTTAGGGGYMVFVNAAYRTDIAFLDTIKNLCPNTYYQYSAWFRNMCSKCSCDATGKGATSAGYTPTVTNGVNDSSGVHPNMTFNINGYDYYTTGDILYTGQWIQKGFTYVTGPTDTAMIIYIRNNAPGGGGNDWAIDDIGVATCAPNVTLTPNKPDTLCMGADDTVRFKVSSYFNSYTNYLIQKSTDGGATWATPGNDTTGAPATGTATPVYNSGTGNYEYVATRYYPLNVTDTLTTYRLIVATTSGNLSNSNCSAYATAQKIVVSTNCMLILPTNIILFKGKLDNGLANLQWVTTNETGNVTYTVERSYDQSHYEPISTLDGTAVEGLGATYNFTDPKEISQPTYYRIHLVSGKYEKYSTIVMLSNSDINFDVQSVTNPFTDWLAFNMTAPDDGQSAFTLIDMYGRMVKQQKQSVTKGMNSIRLYNLGSLAGGTYTLQVQYNDKIISKRVIKFASN
jgi:trimeric autotransporter adhesin